MSLTKIERRVLRAYAHRAGGNRVREHANTRHALQRKGLIVSRGNGKPGWRISAAGRAALVAGIPDIFADLFPGAPR